MTVMDQESFEVLWSDAAPRVRIFLAAACRDSAMVDDFMQEVALTAWRKRSQFDRDRRFEAWVIGMSRLVLLRHRRDTARQKVILAPDLIEQLEALATAAKATVDDRLEALAACVSGLSESDRNLLKIRYQLGKPLAEAARQAGRSHGAIRTALVRLRDRLKQCVRERLGGDDDRRPVDVGTGLHRNSEVEAEES